MNLLFLEEDLAKKDAVHPEDVLQLGKATEGRTVVFGAIQIPVFSFKYGGFCNFVLVMRLKVSARGLAFVFCMV